MWQASHTETTNAKPEDIWQQWTDVLHWPRQDDSLDSATINGPFEVGNIITLKPKGSPRVAVRLIEVTPNTSFSSIGSLPLTKLRFDHQIASTDTGVQFTQSVSMNGSLAWLFAGLMGKTMAINLEKRMKKLAQLVVA